MTGDPRGNDRLAAAWERALAAASDPLADVTTLGALAGRLAALTASVRSEESGPDGAGGPEEVGHEIGRLLAEAHLTSPEAVRQAVTLLAGRWPDGAGPGGPRLLGAVAAGHASAAQDVLLRQQEAIHRAAFSARDRAERALRDSEARFRALFAEAAVGIAIGDVSGQVLEVNDAFHRMLGYTREEFLGRPVEQFQHEQDPSGTWEEYAALVAGRIDSFRLEKPYRHKDGHAVWTHLTVSLVRDPAGRPLFQVAMVEDVTDRRRLAEELRREATHDALTGLPNRALFLQRLEAAVAGPPGSGRVAVLFIDLDSFKFVNDSRGHLVGDQVLVSTARRLHETARAHDALLARLAGDEFVVLMTGPADRTHPVLLAEELLAALEAPILVEGQQPVHLRASIGVAELPAAGAGAEELLRTADLALHAAKEDGKGRVVAHDPTRTARQLSRFRIATDLPGAADRGELALVYQPLIRLGTGELHGAEALLRWHHPQLGEITPEEFVPIAEDSSTIVTIGRWVLQQACRDLASGQWPAVNINVSVRQLYSPSFVDDVRRCLAEHALAPDRLRIEVTESVVMHGDVPGPVTELRRLADLGVQVVLDDFGTGYSNLAALRRLPLQELKLAGTFLEGLRSDGTADSVDLRILATVVDLAHALGLIVTAEGVETADQDARVRAIGCDVGQGHFYAVPAPATGAAAEGVAAARPVGLAGR